MAVFHKYFDSLNPVKENQPFSKWVIKTTNEALKETEHTKSSHESATERRNV